MQSLQESLELLEELGITLPTPAYLAGLLLFGIVGLVLWVKGRRRRNAAVKWIGLALMLYPYFVWGTAALYIVGAGLCAGAVWAWRRGSA